MDAILRALLEAGVVPSEARTILGIYKRRQQKQIRRARTPEYNRLVRQLGRENRKLKRLETTARNLRENNGAPSGALPDFSGYTVDKSDLRIRKNGLVYKRDLEDAIKSIQRVTRKYRSSRQDIATFNVLLEYERNGYIIYVASSEAEAAAFNEPEIFQLGVSVDQFSPAEVAYIQKRRPEWFRGVRRRGEY